MCAVRLEVKQSAARQSWETKIPSSCRWDIKARTGRWEKGIWIPEPKRAAHIYILAHHHIWDDSADHRDPTQWSFYVVPAHQLPESHSIGLGPVRRLVSACDYDELPSKVNSTAESLKGAIEVSPGSSTV